MQGGVGLVNEVGEIGRPRVVSTPRGALHRLHVLRALGEQVLEASSLPLLPLTQPLPLEGAAELAADRRRELQEALVRAARQRVHELDHRGHLHADDHRERPGRALRDHLLPGVVRGHREVGEPQRQVRRCDLPRQAARRHEALLDRRRDDEVEEVELRRVRVPDVGGDEGTVVVGQ